jgi:hypothetical protein
VLDERFAESWVNSTHRVLGLKLRPFSLWHRFQLEILESPILLGKQIEPFDLERACRCCQLRYPQTVSSKTNMWSLRWRLAGRDFDLECKKFGAYLDDFFAPPKFLPSIRQAVHQPEVFHPPPEEIRIISAVIDLTKWPENKIWDMPIGQTYWYAAGQWYQDGRELDFLTPEHLVLRDRIAAMKEGQSNGS